MSKLINQISNYPLDYPMLLECTEKYINGTVPGFAIPCTLGTDKYILVDDMLIFKAKDANGIYGIGQRHFWLQTVEGAAKAISSSTPNFTPS